MNLWLVETANGSKAVARVNLQGRTEHPNSFIYCLSCYKSMHTVIFLSQDYDVPAKCSCISGIFMESCKFCCTIVKNVVSVCQILLLNTIVPQLDMIVLVVFFCLLHGESFLQASWGFLNIITYTVAVLQCCCLIKSVSFVSLLKKKYKYDCDTTVKYDRTDHKLLSIFQLSSSFMHQINASAQTQYET